MMAAMTLREKILGTPFVYNHVRPFVIGGLDLSAVYQRLELHPDDVVLDLGCGTGDALKYLPHFARYEGFDTDPIAIRAANERYGSRASVTFTSRACTADDFARILPTAVVMAGLLHHLDERDAVELLSLAANTPSVRRVVTQDIVYLPGAEHLMSNLLATLDRGQYCR
ncbi:MAG TPA: class I SAM-dependent methyltransferase, partial [Polyangiaceae bacterium]